MGRKLLFNVPHRTPKGPRYRIVRDDDGREEGFVAVGRGTGAYDTIPTFSFAALRAMVTIRRLWQEGIDCKDQELAARCVRALDYMYKRGNRRRVQTRR